MMIEIPPGRETEARAPHPQTGKHVDMDLSSRRYHHSCWPRFGKSSENMGHCLAPNDFTVQWLRC
jgi:hypothetical protein